MDEKTFLLKTAQAIRTLVSTKEELEKTAELRQECLKLAFEMAEEGRIENDGESILRKTDELMQTDSGFEVTKQAWELSKNKHESFGSLPEKTASRKGSDSDDVGQAEMAFLEAMQSNY